MSGRSKAKEEKDNKKKRKIKSKELKNRNQISQEKKAKRQRNYKKPRKENKARREHRNIRITPFFLILLFTLLLSTQGKRGFLFIPSFIFSLLCIFHNLTHLPSLPSLLSFLFTLLFETEGHSPAN